MSLTQPNVFFAVNKQSLFMYLPTIKHWHETKCVLRYLQETLNHGLHIQRQPTYCLHAFADAYWANDPDDRPSTTGYIIFLVSPYQLEFQEANNCGRSTTEVEYRAIASSAVDLNLIVHLLSEFQITPSPTLVIYCDNISVRYVCANPIFRSRIKHVVIDFFFVQDQVAKQPLRIYISCSYLGSTCRFTHQSSPPLTILSSSVQYRRY